MAIAAAFVTSTKLGVITSLAVIVHEVPQEIADYAILRRENFGKRRALAWLSVVQLTAGVGAAATLVTSSIDGISGIVLSIAAGTFLYIATVELLPDVLRARPRRGRIGGIVGLLLGIAAVACVS